MNFVLMSNRPAGETEDDFRKMWDNAGYTLSALHKTLVQFQRGLDVIKADDFDTPNHYAKLMFQQGKIQALREVMALLPESAKD